MRLCRWSNFFGAIWGEGLRLLRFIGWGRKLRPMEEIRWGGFFRRCLALSIDIAILSLFSLLLYRLISVAYRLGLATYQHSL